MLLTGIAFDGRLRATRFAGPGVVFALVALVLFALMAITSDIALETMSLAPAVRRSPAASTARLVILLVVVVARTGIAAGRRPTNGPSWSRSRLVGAFVVAGTLDVLGLIAFAIGLETAPTWMVGLAASFGPAVTIIVAVAFLGERLKPVQWVGLAGILTRDRCCIAVP